MTASQCSASGSGSSKLPVFPPFPRAAPPRRPCLCASARQGRGSRDAGLSPPGPPGRLVTGARRSTLGFPGTCLWRPPRSYRLPSPEDPGAAPGASHHSCRQPPGNFEENRQKRENRHFFLKSPRKSPVAKCDFLCRQTDEKSPCWRKIAKSGHTAVVRKHLLVLAK